MKNCSYLLDLIKSVIPLRTCTYDLFFGKVTAVNYKVCLEFHLGNEGPCELSVGGLDYNRQIQEIGIIKGNLIFPPLFQNARCCFATEMKLGSTLYKGLR